MNDVRMIRKGKSTSTEHPVIQELSDFKARVAVLSDDELKKLVDVLNEERAKRSAEPPREERRESEVRPMHE